MTIRLVLQLMAVAMIASLLSAATWAQNDIDPGKYTKVKAGMVLNFVRYTTWPDDAFEDSENVRARLIITILGRDAMQEELEAIVDEERVQGRHIEVRRIARPTPDSRIGRIEQTDIDRFHAELRESHLLFVANSERERYHDVLEIVEEKDVLTVSDIADFASEGGMLGLAVRSGRVAFDANTGEISETKLNVSSKLLRLANVVETRKRPR
jgi:hypothetical protein